MEVNLKALFEGSEFSEDFIAKVTEAFNTAVAAGVESKLEEETQKLEESYKEKNEEYKDYLKEHYESLSKKYIDEELIPKIDMYADYISGEYVKENEKQIEESIKVQYAEDFLQSLVSVAEQLNVGFSSDAGAKLSEMQAKVDDFQKRFEDQLQESAKLKESANALLADKAFNESVKEKALTVSQIEKITEAATEIKYISESQYKSAISDVIKSYFPKTVNENTELNSIEEQKEETKKPEHVNESTNDWYNRIFNI